MPRQEYMAREILALQAAEGSRNILCTDVCAQSILTGTEIDFRLAFLDERGGSAGTRELKGLYTAYQYMKPFIGGLDEFCAQQAVQIRAPRRRN